MHISREHTASAVPNPMRVVSTSTYRGPHLYSHTPMIRIQLDLGALEERPTNTLPGFLEALLTVLPGLCNHGCSYGEPGGLVRRMEEGTWLGHVTEHVALELQSAAGTKVERGKTRSVKGQPGVYNVMYAYKDEEVGLLGGRLALRLVDSLLPEDLRGIENLDRVAESDTGGAFDFEAEFSELRQLVRSNALGPTTASLVHEAERRGIPWCRVDETSLVRLGMGSRQKYIRASTTSFTPEISTGIAADKDLTRFMLSKAGLPVPEGRLVRSAEEAIKAAEELGYPVVTKPLDGNHGRGVNVGLGSAEEVRWGFGQAQEHSRSVIVEKFFAGSDHRILVVNGQLIAVAERVPASVVGDGASTISALVEQVNQDPRRGEGHESFLTRIELDDCVAHFIAKRGLTFESVPAAGEKVFLRPTANLSTGGTAIDRTDEIHPSTIEIALRAAAIVGLDITGIDFVSPDISRPVTETGGGIIEVNAGPGFRMHIQPTEGRSRNVARPVLEMMYPKGSESRIPIFAITGTNGKSTTARMLGHILQQTGKNVGLTSTTGIYFNGQRLMVADASGPKSARMVLANPRVDVAVLETARGGILREGLGFNYCDVGAVLNVTPDHLGLKGVDTIEDLAAVKSVVVEAVGSHGWSILNADDPLVAAMARHAGGSICYFSMAAEADRPEFLSEHIERGGLAVVREITPHGTDLCIWEDAERVFVMDAAEIPATLDGAAEFNVANALAAIAMAYAHGLPFLQIRQAMRTFSSSFENSPGRLNVVDIKGFRVILDYAHNPHGLTALGETVAKIRSRYRRTIGLIGIAGDRRDEDIRRMGALASQYFDHIVLKEDDELRGRAPTTIAALMREGAIAAGCAPSRLQIVLPEDESVDLCLRLARPGDLVVLTADHVDQTWAQIKAFGETPDAPVFGGAPSRLRA